MIRRPPVRFPELAPGLGVGFDLRWGDDWGAARRFLEGHRDVFHHVFVSWQARRRGRPRLDDYVPAWDAFFEGLEGYPVRALHHTALNLASSASYEREDLLAFTNALVARYDLRWVNEDLGFWSLCGSALPYPLPPFLTGDGLHACVRNVQEVLDALDVPLLVEFPGFSQGTSPCIGEWDAYDFFREVVERTGAPCTLDVGHLLSWRWLRGLPLLEDLHRLPLEHCFEVHLSGVRIDGDRFVDAHHGVLIDAQLALLERLRARCPNLRAITFEDPRFDEQGVLHPSNRDSLERLVAACSAEPVWEAPRDIAVHEQVLYRLIRDPAAREEIDDQGLFGSVPASELQGVAALIREQQAARLRERFALVFEACPDGDELLARLGIPDGCLEEAFYTLVSGLDLVDPHALRHAYHRALVTALALDPEPDFPVPAHVQGGPGRWWIVEDDLVWAAVGTRVITGPLAALTRSGGSPART